MFDLRSTLSQDMLEFLLGRDAFRRQVAAATRDRIALRFGRAFLRRLVQLLVVGERMGVGPDDLGVDERRSLARARVLDRLAHRAVARDEVGAIDALHEKEGKCRDESRDVAAGSLDFDRH